MFFIISARNCQEMAPGAAGADGYDLCK